MIRSVASLLVGTALVTTPSAPHNQMSEQNGMHWVYYRPQTIVQPLIMDSSLLFLSPDLVWRCNMKEKYADVEWFEADFTDVESCTCTREVYTYVPDKYRRRYDQKLLSRELRARLTRESGTTFRYSEYDPSDSTVLRSFRMLFDASKVVRTDTAFLEELTTGKMTVEITKLAKLERMQ